MSIHILIVINKKDYVDIHHYFYHLQLEMDSVY